MLCALSRRAARLAQLGLDRLQGHGLNIVHPVISSLRCRQPAGAAQSCDAVRGAASAKANMSTNPARDGTMVSPSRRSTATSSGLGVIKPREIQARIFENDSAPGSTDPMIGAPSCGSGAPSCGFSASLIFWSSLSRSCAAANACNVGAIALHAFVTSAVKRVQPTEASKASRSIRSTLNRSRTIWSLITCTERFSAMASRFSRNFLMSSALFEALIAAAEALVTAADRCASTSPMVEALKPVAAIKDMTIITGQRPQADAAATFDPPRHSSQPHDGDRNARTSMAKPSNAMMMARHQLDCGA